MKWTIRSMCFYYLSDYFLLILVVNRNVDIFSSAAFLASILQTFLVNIFHYQNQSYKTSILLIFSDYLNHSNMPPFPRIFSPSYLLISRSSVRIFYELFSWKFLLYMSKGGLHSIPSAKIIFFRIILPVRRYFKVSIVKWNSNCTTALLSQQDCKVKSRVSMFLYNLSTRNNMCSFKSLSMVIGQRKPLADIKIQRETNQNLWKIMQ